jgi:hypothetical protein
VDFDRIQYGQHQRKSAGRPTDVARASLGRWRELMKRPNFAANQLDNGFLREAATLIDGK